MIGKDSEHAREEVLEQVALHGHEERHPAAVNGFVGCRALPPRRHGEDALALDQRRKPLVLKEAHSLVGGEVAGSVRLRQLAAGGEASAICVDTAGDVMRELISYLLVLRLHLHASYSTDCVY